LTNFDLKKTTSVLKVNVSPLRRGHSLFVPDIGSIHKQGDLNPEALVQVIDLFSVLQNSPNETLIIGYNSPGAFSSVNHLHFHILNLPDTLIETNLPSLKQE
jgi:diadenosine tetraphosphate (Ap4A) HIT family hydrolase